MAENTIGSMAVAVGVDLRDWETGLEEIKSEAASAGQEVADALSSAASNIPAYVKDAQDLAATISTAAAAAQDFAERLGEATSGASAADHRALAKSFEEMSTAVGDAKQKIDELNGAASSSTAGLSEAYQHLGIVSTQALQATAEQAKVAFNAIEQSGTASAHDIQVAWIAMEEARIAASVSAGQKITDADHQALENAKQAYADFLNSAKSNAQQLNEAFSTLGVTSTQALQKSAEEAKAAYTTIEQSGVATARDIQAAWIEMETARQAAAVAAGERITEVDKKTLSDAKAAYEDLSKTVSEKMAEVGSKMQSIGGTLTAALTVPIVAAGTALFAIGNSFDEAFDHIRAATGNTGAVLEGLQESFKAVANIVPNSFNEIQIAIASLNTRMSLTGPALEAMATQFLNLSRITGTDIGQNIRETTRLFAEWGVTAKEQAATMDFLFRVTQTTGIGFTQLAGQLTTLGPQFKELGFTLQQAAAMIGQFEKLGIPVTQVLSSLRIALKNMTKEGIEDPSLALKILVDRIKDAGSAAEGNAIAFKVFGRAGATIGEAIRDGRFEVGEFVKQLQAMPDTINQAAADTLSFADKLKLFGNQAAVALEPLGSSLLKIGEQVLERLQPVIDVVASLAKAFSELSPAAQMAIIGFTGLLAAIGPVVAVLGTIVVAVSSLVSAWPILAGAIGVSTTALSSFAITAGAVGIAIGAIAVEIGILVTAYREMSKWTAEAEASQKRASDSMLVFETRIRQQGIDISEVKKQYDSGKLTYEEYTHELNKLVDAYQKLHPVQQKAAEGAGAIVRPTKDAAGAQKEYEEASAKLKKQLELLINGHEKKIKVVKETAKSYHEATGELKLMLAVEHEQLKMHDDSIQQLARKIVKGETWNQVQADMDKLARGSSEGTSMLAQSTFALQQELDRATGILPTYNNGVGVVMPAALKLAMESLDKFNAMAQKTNLEKAKKEMQEFTGALSLLGVRAQDDLTKLAQAYDTVAKSALATAKQKYEAEYSYLTKRVEAERIAGETVTESEKKRIKALENILESYGIEVKKIWGDVRKLTSDVLNTFMDGVVRATLDFKNFGSHMLSTLKDIGAAIEQFILKQIMKAIVDTDQLSASLTKMLKSFFGVGQQAAATTATKVAGAAAPGAVTTATNAAGAVPGAVTTGTGTGAGSGAGQVVGSSLTGIVGAVGSIATAISSIIGNFQMHGMNESLKVIVNHTLVAANELMNLRADEWERESHLMLKLDDIWNEIRNVVAAIQELALEGIAVAVGAVHELNRSVREGMGTNRIDRSTLNQGQGASTTGDAGGRSALVFGAQQVDLLTDISASQFAVQHSSSQTSDYTGQSLSVMQEGFTSVSSAVSDSAGAVADAVHTSAYAIGATLQDQTALLAAAVQEVTASRPTAYAAGPAIELGAPREVTAAVNQANETAQREGPRAYASEWWDSATRSMQSINNSNPSTGMDRYNESVASGATVPASTMRLEVKVDTPDEKKIAERIEGALAARGWKF